MENIVCLDVLTQIAVHVKTACILDGEVGHCQAGRRRAACRVVRSMVSVKNENVSKGVSAGKAGQEAGLQYNMQ